MNEPTRLFDCIEQHMSTSPARVMFGAKENGSWKEYTVKDVSDTVNKLSAGLLKLGISSGDHSPEGRDKIALISKNRPEWLMLDLAVQQIGAVLTPVYPTISINELEFILTDAAVKILFVNDCDLFEKVNEIRSRLPELQEIYSFENEDGVKNWKEILNLANEDSIAEVKKMSAQIKYEDLATIIYTSGTTGKPKGVMLSHKNILSNVLDSMPCFPPGENMKALSFLPLNHIFERMVSYIYLFKGASIYYAESFETIGDNLREVKPQMFTTVPRLLEKVYDRIMDKGKELTGVKRTIFFWAHNLATKFEINKNQGMFYNMQMALANKLIFSKWREALGNEITNIVSGGAACQVRLIRIFTAAKIVVMEGYGLTETSPVISVNRYQESGRMFGTVGPLIRNVQVRIAEDGEILCKGPNVMMGYYKRPDLTAEAIEDGWFKTGDIGMMINDTFLKITDRKKEMFKTSGGKYVAPIAVENKLKESTFIENLMVTGAERKYVGALIIPAFDALKKWCEANNIRGSNEELINNEEVQTLYKNEVEHYNKEFSHVEQIKKFELLPHDWSVETGEMTPKLSLKRKVIMEKYKDAVGRIYGE
ncbi:MAG: long-chain fatty acid--CoA ligase [Ginsengibacter sp.]